MGRPETIVCTRCGTSVTVKARGPVPSYCAACRRTSRRSTTRPTHISCEQCGTKVLVGSRGPLPKKCRGGCATEPRSQATLRTHMALRPWDRTGPVEAAPPARPLTAARSRPEKVPESTTTVQDTQPATVAGGIVTRIDTHHPATIVDTEDLDRRIRAQQLRHALSIGLWIAVIALIAVVVFVGSQPAPPGF